MTKNRLLATSIVALGMFYSAEGMKDVLNKVQVNRQPATCDSIVYTAANSDLIYEIDSKYYLNLQLFQNSEENKCKNYLCLDSSMSYLFNLEVVKYSQNTCDDKYSCVDLRNRKLSEGHYILGCMNDNIFLDVLSSGYQVAFSDGTVYVETKGVYRYGDLLRELVSAYKKNDIQDENYERVIEHAIANFDKISANNIVDEETIEYLREIKYNEIYDKLNVDNCLEYVVNNGYIKFDNDKVVYIDSFFMDVLLDVVWDDKLSGECFNEIIVPAGKSLLTLWDKDNQKMNVGKLLRIIGVLNEKELDDEEEIKVDQSFIDAIKADPAKFFLYTDQEYAFKREEISPANNAEKQRLQDSIDAKILLLRTFKDYYKSDVISEIEEIIDVQTELLIDVVGDKTDQELEAAKQSSIYGNVKMFLGLFPDGVTNSLAKKGFKTKERTLLGLTPIDNYCLFIASRYFDTLDDHVNLAMATTRLMLNMEKFHYNPICDNIYKVRLHGDITKPSNLEWDDNVNGTYSFFNVCSKYFPNVRQFYISKGIMSRYFNSKDTFDKFKKHIPEYTSKYNQKQNKKDSLTQYTEENGLQIFCSFPLNIVTASSSEYLNNDTVTLARFIERIDQDVRNKFYDEEKDISQMPRNLQELLI